MSLPSAIAVTLSAIGLYMAAMVYSQRGSGPGQRHYLPFAAFCLLFSIYMGMAAIRHDATSFPLSRRLVQAEFVLSILSLPVMLTFIRQLTGRTDRFDRVVEGLLWTALGLALLALPTELMWTRTPVDHEIWFFGQPHHTLDAAPGPLLPAAGGPVLLSLVWFVIRLFRAARQGVPGAWLYFAGALVLVVAAINDLLLAGGLMRGTYLLGYGFLGLAIAGSLSLTLDSRRRALDLERATARLQRLRAAEDNLARSERLAVLGRALSGVSHELNNPLTTVVSVAEGLRHEAFPEKLHRQVKLMRREAVRAGRLVRGMLEIARGGDMEATPLDVTDLFKQLVDLRQDDQRRADITMTVESSGRSPVVEGDPDQLFQLLFNLVINAEQAIELRRAREDDTGAGHIVVSARVQATDVFIVVQDDGIGLPRDAVGRLFDPFFTTKPRGEGTGLGLFLAATVARRHHGTLAAENVPAGGARMTVCLPLSDRTPVRIFDPLRLDWLPDVQAADSPLPLHSAALDDPTTDSVEFDLSEILAGLRIAVVDDEEGVLSSLESTLATAGARVAVARSAEEAADLLGDGDYDAVICDVLMPDVDGPSLYRWVRDNHPDVADRFVFMTGDVFATGVQQLCTSRKIPLLQKPFRVHDLAIALLDATRPPAAPHRSTSQRGPRGE